MSDWIEQLERLRALRDNGHLTDMEFEAEKARIMAVPHKKVGAAFSGPTQVVSRSASRSAFIESPQIDNAPSFNSFGGQTRLHKLSGSTLGHYKIISLIDQGGMGIVYKAIHIDPNTAKKQGVVALKQLLAKYTHHPDFRERFQVEAAIGKQINHPGICKVIDFFSEGDQLVLVMEYISGQELQNLVPPNGLPFKTALNWLQSLSVALDYLHANNIVHRDLKPINIKITAEGAPIVMDFGIAKDLLSPSKLTQTGQTLGTTSYMAPEQMSGKEIGPWTDQYALGLIAYQLLCGLLPWADGDTDFMIYEMKIRGELPTLHQNSHRISHAVSRVVERALFVQPSLRFASCGAFINALKQAFEQRVEVNVYDSNPNVQAKAHLSLSTAGNQGERHLNSHKGLPIPPFLSPPPPPPGGFGVGDDPKDTVSGSLGDSPAPVQVSAPPIQPKPLSKSSSQFAPVNSPNIHFHIAIVTFIGLLMISFTVYFVMNHSGS